jgi:hypothetical protein
VVAIAAGDYFNLALKKDGKLVAWGRNDLGQINIPSWVSNVVAISCSGGISMALVNNGSPWILGQPQDQTTYSGMSATFKVLAIGTTSLNYQWQFNGTNIIGATNVSLILTNAQTTNSGVYSVIVSNAIGSTVSSNGILSVVASAPIVVALPADQIVALRSNTSVVVSATGSLPLSYQWQFQGTNVLKATNLMLSITNAQWTNEGIYTVVITNAYGSITSSPSFLNVVDLGEALNATNLTWITSATGYWFPEASINHDGLMAAQSGSLPYLQWSTLQTTVTGPGTMTFFWKVNRFGNVMYFTATNETSLEYGVITSTNWRKEVVYLGGGSQTLQWWFKRAPSGSSQDAGWLDEVSYTDGATTATISASPTDQSLRVGTNATFAVSAYGTPPLSYQWLFNSNALNEATNAFLTVSNIQLINAGKYSVVVTNLYGSACSSIANLAVLIPNFNSSNSASIFTANGFQLQLDGLTGHGSIIFYASTNLVDWLPIFTNPPVAGSLQFIDSNALNTSFLFYRAAEQ